MSKELFKEAIADAKAVREAALANAKAALEEALTPKLQSMLAAKLNEMEYEEEELEEVKKEEEMEEAKKSDKKEKVEEVDISSTGHNSDDMWHARAHAASAADAIGEAKEEELEEDFDLSEILAELNESDDKDADNVKEAKEEEEEKEEESEEEGEEEEEVEEMPKDIEDLKDLIRDIISQEMDTEAPADEEEIVPVDDMSGEMGPDMGADTSEDEIDLEELLAELDSLDEADDKKEMEEAKKKEDKEEKKMNEGKFSDWINSVFGTKCLKELKAAIKAGEDEKTAFVKFSKCMDATTGGTVSSGTGPVVGGFGQSGKTSKDVYGESELAEAIETINTLRSELNEVNLLNAKLLYVNKLFKAKNLTESQKLKVIASFDKATNVKEAKVVFESLESALNKPAKNAIKESLGFASKAIGVAPKPVIVESNDVIARMQKLANIK